MRNPFSRRHRRPFELEPRAEVNDELAFHLEQRVRDFVARGMSPEAARAAALERFGDLHGVRSECTELLEADRRAADRRDWFGDLRQDLRYGLRAAVRSPLFTLLAIVTLALGIGANAAVFGVVKSVLLDALPYRDADRLVRVYGRLEGNGQDRSSLSPGTVADIGARSRSFASVAAFAGQPREAIFTASDEPRVVTVAWTEPALFRTLGVTAATGRLLRDDDIADTVRSVVLTHGAWQRLFGGDPEIVGRDVRVNGLPRTVVGVLPRRFVGPVGDADFYFPFDYRPALEDPVGARGSHWLGFVGRLGPGVELEAARRELLAIADALAKEHPRDNRGISVNVMPVRDAMVGDTRTPLLVLMASAALVLLITCANLAGALLSRTISRRKELAVRVALGAGHGRLVRQLLTESMVLATAGGATGILLAMLGLAVLRRLALPALPEYASLSLDPGAVLFTAALALATGVAFGLAPALSVRRWNVQATLREETRGASEGLRSRYLRGALVAGQIALSVSLLAGAGLLARSLWAMTVAPLGFRADGVLTVGVQLPNGTYRTPQAQAQFYDRLEERLRELPGVSGVASTAELPTRVGNRNGIVVLGRDRPSTDAIPFVLYTPVSDDYFRTLGIPLLAGRAFGPSDHPDAPPTMVVSQSMARLFWPRGGAVGAQVRMGPDPDATPFTVVGIVGDVRNDPARTDAEPMAYGSSRVDIRGSRAITVRTSGEPITPIALVAPFRRTLASLDAGVPMRDARPMRDLLSEGLSARRLPVVLMTAFGALALLLSSVGVYAMFASMAAAREREFGVRVALGSTPRRLAALVLRQGGVWMLAGLAGGAMGVALVARAVGKLLYGVAPFDPVALGAAVLLLLACATIALLGPVRRATRVDPITVLR